MTRRDATKIKFLTEIFDQNEVSPLFLYTTKGKSLLDYNTSNDLKKKKKKRT